ncbi:MAG: peptide deformylase [SAR86 cluster bacterium]|uniref:Peptide deformylase n=1 Tax=SAR86 cluster bacterium TaxID=2030880 RepID=A0A2A4MT47_9GAMM|nr:MAG: peptide deformylase [SAR86 cluster bacterium]
MTVLSILEFPDPRLRKKASRVTVFDQKLQKLIDNMLETMYEADGIGLAATQVDRHMRVVVIDVSETKDSPQIFINPTFEIIDAQLNDYDEGCLSVPGYYETVSRPSVVRITAQDIDGAEFQLEADTMLSTCIQHEIDHLEGKLFVDYISSLKRQRIRSKLEKQHKKSA